jgi:hypothetical protein
MFACGIRILGFQGIMGLRKDPGAFKGRVKRAKEEKGIVKLSEFDQKIRQYMNS